PLADRRGADIDRDLAVGSEHEARALLGTGCAALEVAADGGAAVAPIDQLALHRRLRAPIDFRTAARERDPIVHAIGSVSIASGSTVGSRYGISASASRLRLRNSTRSRPSSADESAS